MTFRNRIFPGFGISLGVAVLYLGLLVLLPLAAIIEKSLELNFLEFWNIVSSPRAIAAYKLSLSISLLAALINCFSGFLVAWVLVRYDFPGKKLIDCLVDLPFALPTAVAGISLTVIYSPNGLLGQYLQLFGIKIAFSQLGILVALIFVSLPFVIRTVQPVIAGLNWDLEEASASLGATRFQTFRQVLLPAIFPSLITGFSLAFARAIGEYGSVVFISGNMPFRTEIVPFLIMSKLEQFDYKGATALAAGMLMISFALLVCINYLRSKTLLEGEKFK